MPSVIINLKKKKNTELVSDIKELSTNAQTLVQMDQNMTKAPWRFFREVEICRYSQDSEFLNF